MKSGFINLETFVAVYQIPEIFASFKKINGISSMQDHELSDIYLFSQILISKSRNKEIFFGYIFDNVVQIAFREQFDLLRFSKNSILNIELKSEPKDIDEISNQLERHNFLLNSIPGDRKVNLFTFVSSNQKVYRYIDGNLTESSVEEIVKSIESNYIEENLLNGLSATDLIHSPYSDIQKFLSCQYFLNDEQKKIVEDIVSLGNYHSVITGGPGTGKSLILFEIARRLSSNNSKILFVFTSKLDCKYSINENVLFEFTDVLGVNWYTLKDNHYDYILIDEAQRLRKEQFSKLFETNAVLIFSADKAQTMRPEEQQLDVEKQLTDTFVEHAIFKLKDKVRTDESLSTFIFKFFDKGHKGLQPMYFPKVNAIYFEQIIEAKKFIDTLVTIENYVSIEPAEYVARSSGNVFNRKIYHGSLQAFEVIGREYNNVVIPINYRHSYNGNKLVYEIDPGYYPYLASNGFFQAITRVRENLLFVVIGNQKMYHELQNLISWKENSKNSYISHRLIRLRELNGLDKTIVAKRCNCSLEKYEKIEASGLIPDNKFLKNLSKLYNIESQFLNGEPTPLNYTDFDIIYQKSISNKHKDEVNQINEMLIDVLKNLE